jgi:hypothetical protein
MKKKLLLLTLTAGSIFSLQSRAASIVKIDTAGKVAPETAFVKLPASDYQKLVSTAVDYKTQIIYNPFLTGDEKTAMQINYDRYIYNLKKSTKVDSLLTLPADDYQKLVNTATDYKTGIIYNPFLTGDEKTAMQISYDRYLYNLKKSVKADAPVATK